MATLEKIRKRSVLLFTIIIVALLAFILGDFLTSGRTFFSDPTTLAKVDGHKIDINEFSRRVEEIRARYQQQGQTDIDIAPIQQQVLQQMISEALMNEELDRLGIVVTDAELSAAMTGPNALAPVVQQVNQLGFETPDQMYDMAFNPQKYNIPAEQAAQIQQAWIELEKNFTEQLRQQKFFALFTGTLTANNIDSKALYAETSQAQKLLVAKQDLSTLKDEDFKVTEDELKAQYEKNKNRYKLNEDMRVVDYIVVDVTPSAADTKAAKEEINKAVAALKAQPGTEGVNGNVNFGVKRTTSPASSVARNLKSTLDSMSVNEVAIAAINGNDYTIVKLFGVTNETDSVNIDFAVVEGTQAQCDSMLTALNSGKKSADLLAAGQLAQAQDSIWATLLNPQMAQLKDQILAAPEGRYVALDTVADQQYYRMVRVNSKKAPVKAFDFAEISYTVEPSSATASSLERQLKEFVNGNNTAQLLAENAPKKGYHIFPDHLTASSVQLGRLPETREGVNWAMDAKKGEVSPVFKNEDGSRMIVVALKDIYKEGFAPMTDPDINMELNKLALNDKKAAKLINDYKGKGKSVQDYANMMKVSADSVTVRFAMPMGESALAGRAAAAKKGALVGPFQGANSVIVFQVLDVEQQGLPEAEAGAAQQFNRTQGGMGMSRQLGAILLGNKKVDNRIQKFYRK